jgi:hypothetical protein
MNRKGPAFLLSSLLVATVAAAGVVLLDHASHEQQARAEEFQGLVGGLGFGPAVDLSRCAFCFDPRICPTCSQNQGPIPGGVFFCPLHGCSVFYYPPLEPSRGGHEERDRDEDVP